MNLNEFSYEENDRRYINPQVSLDEQNAFIQNLRDTQGVRNAQIAQQTHNLGTDVPSNLGGLTGSEAYFNARYQTPQTNSIVADLKSAAQANALSTVLNNELEQAKKRYSDAYRAANNRNSGGGGGDDDGTTEGDIELQSVGNGEEYELQYKGEEISGTNGTVSVVNPKEESMRERHLLGPNGQRIPVVIYGYGDTMTMDTPTGSYDGANAAKNYINGMKAKGYKFLAEVGGKTVDATLLEKF